MTMTDSGASVSRIDKLIAASAAKQRLHTNQAAAQGLAAHLSKRRGSGHDTTPARSGVGARVDQRVLPWGTPR